MSNINTEKFIDAEFKDNSPLKTVERIKGILNQHNIKVTEKWNESGVPYCFSMRLTVNGTNFGVNGKGLSKEFTMASAYGELMERLQFGYIGSLGVQKSASFSDGERCSTVIPADEHVNNNFNWYKALAERYQTYTGVSIDPKTILNRFKDENGNIRVMDHYNITNNQRTHFPAGLQGIYTTNGAAAGNTTEECLVQAISETVERHNHIRILYEGICLPDVPEDILSKYKTAYSIINYVRNQGFKVIIKDASLGLKFPVVCAVFIQEKTGKYHTHFGAFPIFEIALERALTETFQGNNLDNIAGFDDFHYESKNAYSAQAITAELIVGTGEKSVDFFSGPQKYSYNDNAGFNGENNLALLRECIAYFRDMGYEILVQDRSSLGFPAYHVIIPGYSEWAIHRLSQEGDDSAYMPYAVRVMRNPIAATEDDIAKYYEYLKLDDQYGSMKRKGKKTFRSSTLLSANIPAFLDDQLLLAAQAYISYQTGEYAQAAEYLNKFLAYKTGSNAERFICLKRYLLMKANGYSDEQIKQTMHYFHLPQTEQWLYKYVDNGQNPFESLVLRCDEKCSADCILSGNCNQAYTQQLVSLILERISQLSFDDSVQKLKTTCL